MLELKQNSFYQALIRLHHTHPSNAPHPPDAYDLLRKYCEHTHLQALHSCQTLVGVPVQHAVQQVDCLRARVWDDLAERGGRKLGEAEVHRLG